MNLSNRLTFSFIFSFVLVGLFALAVAPAMAIVEVAVTADYTADDDAAADANTSQLVVTLTYSPVNPDAGTASTITNGTLDDDTTADVDESALPDSVTVAQSDDTITITVAPVEANQANTVTFQVPGYGTVVVTGIGAEGSETETIQTNGGDITQLQLLGGYLAGKGYLIIGNHRSLAVGGTYTDLADGDGDGDVETTSPDPIYPTMPDITGLHEVRRSQWSAHVAAGTTVPDLFAHFQRGQRGTIGLSVTNNGMDLADDAGNRVGDQNLRTVVINEVMWARDESQVGRAGYTREQWIEVHNRTTTPVTIVNIRLAFVSHVGSNPDGDNVYTDRLSTYPSFTNVWDITDKGQDGNSDTNATLKEFISMSRTNYTDGWNSNRWGKSGELFLPNYRGTPGVANSIGNLPDARTNPESDPVSPNTSAFIINEIGNVASGDWVEIRNKSGSEQSLNNWSLTKVTAFNNESLIYDFPNKKVPAGGIVLLVREHPESTSFADGFDFSLGNQERAIDGGGQDFGADPNVTYLVVGTTLDIPNNNSWLLILRDNKDAKFRNSSHKLRDVAGPARITKQDINSANPAKDKNANGEANKGSIWQTTLFPMNGRKDAANATLSTNRNLSSNVWERNGGKHGFAKEAFSQAPFTGIGYDRNVVANAANGGTPGYPNDAGKSEVGDIGDGTLVISELMLTTDNGRYPQWIELKNTSKTQGVRLNDPDGGGALKAWVIKIENHNSGTWQSNNRPLNVSFNLSDWFNYIPPNQSVLIAAFTGQHSDNLPDERVADVTASKRSAFKMDGRRDMFLNAEGGFIIQIIDSSGAVVDEVGNLDGKAFDTRAGIGLDDPFGWDWPTEMSDNDERVSLIRLKNDDGSPRVGTPLRAVAAVEDDPETADVDESAPAVAAKETRGAVLPMGTKTRGNGMVGTGMMDEDGNPVMVPAKYSVYAWVHASDIGMVDVPRSQETWFGSASDIGTPLHTAGQPLPVSLSFFRPTLEDGKVVIRWTTESELDNAGFNILRSDSRNGEFEQVNDKLIQGKGTTAERNTYKWVDASAKPGAVYYYQIEDVSFAGERNTLTTTKLKGLISAKNKLTTRWSELKSQN